MDQPIRILCGRALVIQPTRLLWGMKLGINKKTGQNWSLTSWRSYHQPALGSFSFGMDPNNTKQFVMWWKGDIIWTSGEWYQGSFGNLKDLLDFNFNYTSNENETYFKYFASYINLDPEGTVNGISGVLYNCISSKDQLPFYGGCEIPSPPQCRIGGDGNKFLTSRNETGKMSAEGFKFEEGENLSLIDCWMKCMKNCSCVAYSYAYVDGTGCEIWSSDTEKFVASKDGRPIYLLTAKSNEKRNIWIVISTVGGALAILILCYICHVLWRRQKAKVHKRRNENKLLREIGGNATTSTVYETRKGKVHGIDEKTNHEMHLFSIECIAKATDNFSSANKLGQGGDGPVYKGKLMDGQEIAVKRLSRSSG
ncbi:Serine/threonine protein kinase [Quillaja saponaria]|uniref:Serine/threonine protein kinase n=1 Tax=Quillaja saponaria TaxID=32244 RepID=A0AAD7LRU4_QUISA|nr:Serine/threonine protein kinase [Quillaja saponaria]